MTKQEILDKFKEQWFATRTNTTIMNWEGLIRGLEDEPFIERWFFSKQYRTRAKNEQLLKENLYGFVVSYFSEYL